MLDVAIVALVFAALAPYLLGPILVRLTQRFPSLVRDPEALARRFYAFCPDIVGQGTGSVGELARELRRSQTFYCWWD